jgi:hypothetical protein
MRIKVRRSADRLIAASEQAGEWSARGQSGGREREREAAKEILRDPSTVRSTREVVASAHACERARYHFRQ